MASGGVARVGQGRSEVRWRPATVSIGGPGGETGISGGGSRSCCGRRGGGGGVLPAAAKLSKTNTTRKLILHRLRFRPLLLSRDQRAGSALMPHPFLRASPAAIPGRGAGLGKRPGCVWFSCFLRDVASFFGVGAVLSPVEGVSSFFWFLCYVAAATDRYSPFSSLPSYL